MFLELKLRIVQRNEHHLQPVGASRNHHLATEILKVRDCTGGAGHVQVDHHVTHRPGQHDRPTRLDARTVATRVLIVPTKSCKALVRQTAVVALVGVQHTIQRWHIQRAVRPDDRLGQRGLTHLDVVQQFTG